MTCVYWTWRGDWPGSQDDNLLTSILSPLTGLGKSSDVNELFYISTYSHNLVKCNFYQTIYTFTKKCCLLFRSSARDLQLPIDLQSSDVMSTANLPALSIPVTYLLDWGLFFNRTLNCLPNSYGNAVYNTVSKSSCIKSAFFAFLFKPRTSLSFN